MLRRDEPSGVESSWQHLIFAIATHSHTHRNVALFFLADAGDRRPNVSGAWRGMYKAARKEESEEIVGSQSGLLVAVA